MATLGERTAALDQVLIRISAVYTAQLANGASPLNNLSALQNLGIDQHRRYVIGTA